MNKEELNNQIGLLLVKQIYLSRFVMELKKDTKSRAGVDPELQNQTFRFLDKETDMLNEQIVDFAEINPNFDVKDFDIEKVNTKKLYAEGEKYILDLQAAMTEKFFGSPSEETSFSC